MIQLRSIPRGASIARVVRNPFDFAQLSPEIGTLTVAPSSGKHICQLKDKTRIGLDRTKLKQPNLTGTVADLKKGRRVEIKHEDAEVSRCCHHCRFWGHCAHERW